MNNSKLIAKNLIGRTYWQAPIVATRIGILDSVAHNLAAVKAIESACGIEISSQTKKLRELMLAANIIKNHTQNLYFNVLPDFLGLDSGSELSLAHPDLFKNVVKLQEFTDQILISIGGRIVHPITSVAGGFKSYPKENGLRVTSELSNQMIATARKTLDLFASLDLPISEPKLDFAALHMDREYAFYDGEIWTSKGDLYTEDKFLEFAHVLSSRTVERITTGPLARYNLNQSHFDTKTKELLDELKIGKKIENPSEIILARAIEIYYFVILSAEILNHFVKDGIKNEHIIPPQKFSSGLSAIESSDGIIIHYCKLNKDGTIEKYEIFTPKVL